MQKGETRSIVVALQCRRQNAIDDVAVFHQPRYDNRFIVAVAHGEGMWTTVRVDT